MSPRMVAWGTDPARPRTEPIARVHDDGPIARAIEAERANGATVFSATEAMGDDAAIFVHPSGRIELTMWNEGGCNSTVADLGKLVTFMAKTPELASLLAAPAPSPEPTPAAAAVTTRIGRGAATPDAPAPKRLTPEDLRAVEVAVAELDAACLDVLDRHQVTPETRESCRRAMVTLLRDTPRLLAHAAAVEHELAQETQWRAAQAAAEHATMAVTGAPTSAFPTPDRGGDRCL